MKKIFRVGNQGNRQMFAKKYFNINFLLISPSFELVDPTTLNMLPALVNTALRESFEEAGILLGKPDPTFSSQIIQSSSGNPL